MLVDMYESPPVSVTKIKLESREMFWMDDTFLHLDVVESSEKLCLEVVLVFSKEGNSEVFYLKVLDLLVIGNLPRGGPDFKSFARKYNCGIDDAVRLSLLQLATRGIRRLDICFAEKYLPLTDLDKMIVRFSLNIGGQVLSAECSADKLVGYIVF